jgi:hypothetical protein
MHQPNSFIVFPADELLTITPKTAQIKAVNSKIVFTCSINAPYDLEQQQSETWPEIIWIGPDQQPIKASRGRYVLCCVVLRASSTNSGNKTGISCDFSLATQDDNHPRHSPIASLHRLLHFGLYSNAVCGPLCIITRWQTQFFTSMD